VRTDQRLIRMMLAIFAAVSLAATMAQADVVTDANARAADIASKLPATPPAVRVMAYVQVSVFEAVNAITGRYPPLMAKINAAQGAFYEALCWQAPVSGDTPRTAAE
jgi:hypothetical protein